MTRPRPEAGWRSLNPALRPGTWAFWAATLYVALVVASLLPGPQDLAILVAAPLTLVVAVLGHMFGHVALHAAAGLVRWPPPVETPSPPSVDNDVEQWIRPPPTFYPAFAQARGQCGWVEITFKVDRQGRPTHAKVLAQAPARVFERAVLSTLGQARLPRELALNPPARTVVTFVIAGPWAPDWAEQRLEGAPTP